MITIKCDRCGKTAKGKDTGEYTNLYYYNFNAPNMDLCKSCQEDFHLFKENIDEKMKQLDKEHEENKVQVRKEMLNNFSKVTKEKVGG